MKFVTASYQSEPFVGVVEEERVFDLRSIGPATLKECIGHGDSFVAKVKDWMRSSNEYYPLKEVKLLSPIPNPRQNIFCVGKNYVDHALELGTEADIPDHPIVFTKPPTSVIGHDEWIPLHKETTDSLDYEGEVAVVIGKRGRNIQRSDAFSHVFGYTIVNDVTARDLQARHKQYFLGKSLDRTCPIGPWIVHHSAIDDPNRLMISTKINGEVRQSSSTEHLIFPIDELIHVLSQGRTLEPGDIIATGTPKGVGKGFTPPRYLQDGDVVEISVGGIGTLRNHVLDKE